MPVQRLLPQRQRVPDHREVPGRRAEHVRGAGVHKTGRPRQVRLRGGEGLDERGRSRRRIDDRLVYGGQGAQLHADGVGGDDARRVRPFPGLAGLLLLL